MPPLRELQGQFATALLSGDTAAVAGFVVADGLPPTARVGVYGNHVLTSLTEALETTYPVVCRLVDRRFFGFAADRYIRRHPPAGPCLVEYGATFADFLATFPPCAGHPYLGDVARLEWAMNTVLHAEDRPPIEPAALGEVAAEDVGRLVLRTDPAAAWLWSPWPVDRIWQANQPEADPEAFVDLASGPARMEIRRQDDRVALRRLAPVAFAFRAALGAGTTLEVAVTAAQGEDPRFELTGALRAVLAEGLLTGLALAPEPSGSRG